MSTTLTPARTAELRAPVDYSVTGLGEQDFYLFNEGSHFRLYEKLAAGNRVQAVMSAVHRGLIPQGRATS